MRPREESVPRFLGACGAVPALGSEEPGIPMLRATVGGPCLPFPLRISRGFGVKECLRGHQTLALEGRRHQGQLVVTQERGGRGRAAGSSPLDGAGVRGTGEAARLSSPPLDVPQGEVGDGAQEFEANRGQRWTGWEGLAGEGAEGSPGQGHWNRTCADQPLRSGLFPR